MKSLVVLNECMFSDEQVKYLKNTFSDVAIYTDTSSEDVAIRRIGTHNIVIMDQFLFSFSERLLKECKQLELIIINTTAYDNIDVHMLSNYGVKLANLRDYATQDVAEVAVSMALTLNNNTQHAQKIVVGKDKVSDIWPGHPVIPAIKRNTLKNQTVGIVGLGNIGQRCAEMFVALGVHVIGFNRSRKYITGVDIVPLRKLFKEADIIVLTLAYKKEMNGIISRELLASVKNTALLVSVTHPNLVDITYLIKHPRVFRGIGFDYLVTDLVRKLLKARKNNIIITPHLGSQSVEAIGNMTETIIEAAVSFEQGKPLYMVN